MFVPTTSARCGPFPWASLSTPNPVMDAKLPWKQSLDPRWTAGKMPSAFIGCALSLTGFLWIARTTLTWQTVLSFLKPSSWAGLQKNQPTRTATRTQLPVGLVGRGLVSSTANILRHHSKTFSLRESAQVSGNNLARSVSQCSLAN
jgi:hypothetical protein